MQSIIIEFIKERINSSNFINKNLLNVNNNIINDSYKYTCFNDEDYNYIVNSVFDKCKKKGSYVSKNIIKARLTVVLNEMSQPYFKFLEESMSYLDNHIYYIQKSDEWLSQRKTMLTGTDAGKVIAINAPNTDNVEEKLFNIAKDKLDYKEILQSPNVSHFRAFGYAMTHGNIYEDVSIAIYELRNKVKVKEYGLISSNKSNFIGASPDGVVVNVDYSDYNSSKRYGRLVEVKNPFSRKINDEIKPEYVFQMLQQQYTCQIYVCDFLETMFLDSECRNSNNNDKPYESIKEMINDVLDTNQENWKDKIHNHNIPYTNLSSSGKEKGFLLNFKRYRGNSKDDFDMKTELFPLTEDYTIKNILNWKKKTVKKMEEQGYVDYSSKVWKLDTLDIKQFVFNSKDYVVDKLPILESSWNRINSYKNKLIEIINQKIKYLAIPEVLSYMKDLKYSKYLTLINDVDNPEFKNLNDVSNINNTSKTISNNLETTNNSYSDTNININQYL